EGGGGGNPGPMQIETQSVVTLATALSPKCPASPESTSASSGKSEAGTVAGSTTQATHDAEKIEQSPHPDAQSIDEGLVAAPIAGIGSKFAGLLNVAKRIWRSIGLVVGHGILASTTASLSVALSALLFYSALQRHHHIHSSPHGYARLVLATTRFQDNEVRPVTLAIRCIGNMSPEPVSNLPRKATIVIEHAIGYPSLVSRS
ncbi:hypothetical protein GGI21_006618, partial [Coemansia aciculifera]